MRALLNLPAQSACALDLDILSICQHRSLSGDVFQVGFVDASQLQAVRVQQALFTDDFQ